MRTPIAATVSVERTKNVSVVAPPATERIYVTIMMIKCSFFFLLTLYAQTRTRETITYLGILVESLSPCMLVRANCCMKVV